MEETETASGGDQECPWKFRWHQQVDEKRQRQCWSGKSRLPQLVMGSWTMMMVMIASHSADLESSFFFFLCFLFCFFGFQKFKRKRRKKKKRAKWKDQSPLMSSPNRTTTTTKKQAVWESVQIKKGENRN